MATKLGDLLEHIAVIGGLAPYFLIDQEKLPSGLLPHVGTTDLDLGLALGILQGERYRELGPGCGPRDLSRTSMTKEIGGCSLGLQGCPNQ